MVYNFSINSFKPRRTQFNVYLQLLLWGLSAANFFYFPQFKIKKLPIKHAARVITPQLKPSIVAFLKQLSDLNLRLLSVDIYQQDMILKGLSYNEYAFHHFLTRNLQNEQVVRHELLAWHKKQNGTWYFNLRILFK
jgi:hypothetical protein